MARVRTRYLSISAAVVLLALLVVGNVTGASAQPGPPVSDVRVVNDATQPVPVALQGTPTVLVGNDDAIAVDDVGSSVPGGVYGDKFDSVISAPGNCSGIDPDLPQGVLFELKSAFVTFSGATLADKPLAVLFLGIKTAAGTSTAELPILIDRTDAFGNAGGILELSGPARLGSSSDAQPGEVFLIRFCLNGGGASSAGAKVAIFGEN